MTTTTRRGKRAPADIHPKVAAGGVVAAITVVILAVAAHFGWHPGTATDGTSWNELIALVATLVAAYLKTG